MGEAVGGTQLTALPMTQTARADLIWLAGFFDGEGSVNFRRGGGGTSRTLGGKPWRLEIEISGTHQRTMKHVSELVGQPLRTYARQPPNATAYRVTAACRKAELFLEEIRPFSITKREQIDLALEAVHVRRTAPRVPQSRRSPTISEDTHRQLEDLAWRIRLCKHQRENAA